MPYQTQRDSLIQVIRQNLNLQPNQFQIFLQKVHKDYPIQTCQTIARMQFDSNRKQEKQKLATSFNFFVEKFFKRQDKNPEVWHIFAQNIATKKQNSRRNELSQWKLSKITQKSFIKFVESFEEEFLQIVMQIYYKLNTSHKILLQGIVIRNDIDQQARISFLNKTLKQYVKLGLLLFQQISVKTNQFSRQSALNQQEMLQEIENRLSEYLLNLKQTFFYLNIQSNKDNDEQYLANKMSKSDQLYDLIHETVFVDFLGQQYKVYPKAQDQKEQTTKILPLLFTQTGSFQKQECLNNLKALGLQTYCEILKRYSHQSTIVNFDQSKILNLMQNIIPSITNQLISMKPKKLQLSCNQKITNSMICTIRSGIPFIFMNNYFWSNYKLIFWKIIYPLLGSSDQELRQFKDDPEAFLAQAQCLSEKQFCDTDKVDSCKTYAAFLLESLVENIDGAFTYVANHVIDMLESWVNRQTSRQVRQVCQTYQVNQSIQTCFTILQILTPKLIKRPQLLQKLRHILTEWCSNFLQLQGLNKSRMLIFFFYSFDQIFREQKKDQPPYRYFQITSRFYKAIAQSLEQSQILSKCAITFYETYCQIQPGILVILDRIIELIETTKQIDILDVVCKVLNQMILNVDYTRLREILQRCLNRLFKDNTQYIKELKSNNSAYSNISMIKCLHSIRNIAKYCKQLPDKEQAKQLMGITWKVFDLFEYIYDVNYGEQLIKIFDAVLSYLKVIDASHFYQFLPQFAQYHKKEKQIGRLFYTYQALLIKGYQYLSASEQGQQFISHIVQNLQIIIRYGYKTRSMIAITLLQFIILKFPKKLHNIDHKQIFLNTESILRSLQPQPDGPSNQSHNSKYAQVAYSIYNLWIIGSSISEHYDLSKLDEYNVRGVCGYHAKMFAVAGHFKVAQLCGQVRDNRDVQQNLERIIYLLSKSIQFLISFQQQNKNRNSKIEEKISEFTKVNPNDKIRQSFVFVKRNLIQQDYNYILNKLQQNISKQNLKQLLNKSNKSARVIYKFK